MDSEDFSGWPASLPISTVNPDSPIPLYYQVENDLRRLINSGNLPAGATLPSELELCRLYGVGRHTMRMALSRLVADDLITRRAGKGTTVLPQLDRMKFYLDRSFTRQMAETGREVYSKVLEVTPATIGPNSPAVFKEKLGAPCLKLVRLRFGDNEPVAIQSTTVLTESCPDLVHRDFNRESLYETLARDCRMIIVEIQHTISAAIAGKLQAELLQISEGDPLLVVSTAAYLENKQIVEDTVSYYRADKYEYRTAHIYTP